MVSWFRTLQYYPDIVTGERVNVAIIAIDEKKVSGRVRKDWSLVQRFGDLDRSVVVEMIDVATSWYPQFAREYQSHYMSSLKFANPCASILTRHALLQRVGDRMLGEGETLVSIDDALAEGP